MKKIIAAILALVLIALLVAALYFVYVYTNEFTTDFKTFYLEVNGIKYVKDTNDLSLGNVRVDVHYTFEFVQTKKPTFSFSLVPTGDNFQFTVDGEKVSWLNIDGLIQAFNVSADIDGIKLECVNKKVSDVLKAVYPNSDIVLPDGIDEERTSRYKLIVTAEDKRTSVSLTFKCASEVQHITLDPSEITF